MAKWLVVSDSHGGLSPLSRLKNKHPDVEGLLFLGDGLSELHRYSGGFKQVAAVKGNCDFMANAPEEMILSLGGQKVYLCHGHRWSVKSGLMSLCLRARELGATVALFGHSHRYTEEFCQGVFMLNPGAFASGSYAVLTLTPDTIKAERFFV